MGSDAHILVVDDEAEVRDLLQEYLIKQGFAVSAAASAAAAREVLAARAVDLVVLDLRMPGEDGLSLARALRTQGGVGIVMLTGSGEVIDRVIGLEVGADDYLAKPFDPRELLARIRSVLRRVRPAPPPLPGGERRAVRFGRHLLDLDAHRLLALDGREVPVTAMEFELLEAFAGNPNRVLSRDRLLELAHRRGNDPFDRSVDIRVARLRQKIEPDPDKPQTIKTVRGVGYVFVPAGEAPDASG
ncbi:MAG TPA: response regulator [Geminicoccaceae bacterium]|nr:response regulator [Geminicoccaceae bacterium]